MGISLGLQVFSVYEELFKDYLGTLKGIADIGYRNVELLSHNFIAGNRFSDLFPAGQLKEKLNAWGLKPISSHEIMVQGKDLDDYDWEAIIRYYAELECPRVVIPWQWFLEREETLRAAEKIDAIGKRMKENGLQLYYHNHAHEFLPTQDTTPFDLLVENTDPAHLKIQLEVAFVQLVGLKPANLVKELGSRCDMVHQTDLGGMARFELETFFRELLEYRRSGQDIMQAYKNMFALSKSTDIGKGDFTFSDFYREMNKSKYLKYAIVENETSDSDKLKSVAKDFAFMQPLVG